MKKIILGLSIIALLVFSGCASTNSTALATASAEKTDNSVVTISLDKISDKATWFGYDSSGVMIRFFAVEVKDGSIKTAFDSCDVCYSQKKGYRQVGEFMVCNNCGNEYPISGLGTENRNPGGCWPSYLPSKIEGNNLVIEKADLEKGRSRF